MSFSAEMKAFLGAYKTGQAINASRTDQDYKIAKQKETEAKTLRDNDPETLKVAGEQAKANLALTQKRMGNIGSGNAQRDQLMKLRIDAARDDLEQRRAARTAGTGILPTAPGEGPPTPTPNGQGALPLAQAPSFDVPIATNPDVPEGTELYADGGLVDDDSDEAKARRELARRLQNNEKTRRPLWQGDELEAARLRTNNVADDARGVGRRLFADGGLVDDEASELTPDDETAEGESTGVLPTAPIAQPVNAPTDVSARRRSVDPGHLGIEGVVAPGVVNDAVKAGMTFGARESGLARGGAIASPRTMAVARQIAAGAGGLSEEEMKAAKAAVDPEGKLTDSQRNMAALGSVYQYWANKGEPQKAEKVAFQMLQYYRNTSQRYAAIAAKAAEGQNLDLATKAMVKAYANVPDGNDARLEVTDQGQIVYSMIGPDGKEFRKGVATPQQLGSIAMGMASGGFDKALLSAAGAREAAEAGGKGAVGGKGAGKTQTASDRAKEEETAMGAVTALKDNWVKDEKNKGKEPDETMWEQMGNVATHIMQGNKVTSKEAARAADLLINPGRTDKTKADFKLSMDDDGTNTIKFTNGLKIKLDDDQLEQIQNARAARIKAASDREAAAKIEADKPSLMSKVAKAGGEIGGAVGNIADDAGGAVGAVGQIGKRLVRQAIPDELYERVGSDAKKIKENLPDLRNTGAIPVDPEDRPL